MHRRELVWRAVCKAGSARQQEQAEEGGSSGKIGMQSLPHETSLKDLGLFSLVQ